MQPFLKHARMAALLLLAAIMAGCGGSGDEYDGFDSSISTSTPNKYLLFFNRQGDLAAGRYTLVVATNAGGEMGTFSVTIDRNDGSATQVINGSWAGAAGDVATCGTGNPCYSFDIQDASGASFTLNSAVDGVLYLVSGDNASGSVVALAAANGGGVPLTLEFSDSDNNSSKLSNAYYDAIDPMGARSTAQEYLALHGLDNPDVHVIFRDSKDLGYGRDMYMVSYANPSACGGQMIVFFVRNFSVSIVDGFAYGPINLEAAIAEDLQHHVGTNAIEFGLGRSDVGDTCSAEPMAKFYTFEPDYSSANAPHHRRVRVDLDARGAKAMPQPCISCHGGKLRPLDRFDRFVPMHVNDTDTQVGDTKSRMQAFEVDTFEFSDEVGHRRKDYEDGLRQLNAAIYCTYPGSAGHAACATHGGGVAAQGDIGEWSGDFGREMLLGWYDNNLEIVGTEYNESFVPPGWTPSPGTVPEGADALFRKVVGPNCFVCHGKRGNELGTDNNTGGDGKDLDFRTWEKFITHADEIERLVFDEGRMPLGLLNYQNFWDDPEKGELLASFIQPYVTDPTGFSARRVDSKGNIILPGRVLARAGPDRVTQPGATITLNAQASLFAEKYSWTVIASPMGSTPVLSTPGKMKTDFSAADAGLYTIRLTASLKGGGSKSDTLLVNVDGGLATAPRDLTFYANVTSELSDCATTCHSSGAPSNPGGIPVYWVADANQPRGDGSTGIPASTADLPSLGFYEQVMARVNLEDIEDSLILKKPSGLHHYGEQRLGFDTSLAVGSADRDAYDMFVNWISEGSVCGGTIVECVR